jgi:hypothetical protein
MQFVSVSSARKSVISHSGKKINLTQQGLESVKNKTVQNNLKGLSEAMKSKEWVDSSGRKGAQR